MSSPDVATCRRALREIREIVAVARLDGAQMSEREALETIAAIADWVAQEGATGWADCGAVIRRLDSLLDRSDLDALDDRGAMRLFGDVSTLLRGGEVSP